MSTETSLRRAAVVPIEVIQTRGTAGDEVWHAVCHCTDDSTAACGLDVTNEPWAADDERACPLCVLAWPSGQPCPWGCRCDECLAGEWV